MASIKPSPDADKLIERETAYICKLGYAVVSKIEAAMLIGRELWYKRRNGSSDYDEELKSIDIRDLKAWLTIFNIPETIEAGGDLVSAAEYTLSKRTCFLKAYLDAVGKE